MQQSLIEDIICKQFNSSNYQLIEKIARGGFGLVYRAKQLNTGQNVAIKFLVTNDELNNQQLQRYIDRFNRETELCSRLEHPNIVRLLDKGCCNGLLYAVFEYINGKTLKQTLLENGPLPAKKAAKIMAQVLDAIAHAHEHGIIHRDIKPANIMLSTTKLNTHAKILDFGISTLASEARQLTDKTITIDEETLCSPSYSAPEQLRGEPPTRKTDIYTWGLVFLECLTAQPAVSGPSTASIFHQQLSPNNIQLPKGVIGHPVAALLQRILQKNPTRRPNSAGVVFKEFNSLNFSTLVGKIGSKGKQTYSNSETVNVNQGSQTTELATNLIAKRELIERKQLTALCVKLYIKAHDTVKFDHEVADTLHRHQITQCVDIAARYGAYHVGNLAGSMVFYMGYPLVSDNDARLSARIALELISKINKRNALLKPTHGVEFEIKIGLHSSMVTVSPHEVPDGEILITASQLAQHANNNHILTTQSSAAQLASYLELQPYTQHSVGPFKQPSTLYSIIAEKPIEAFGLNRSSKSQDQLIGRSHELAALNQLLEQNPLENYKCAHIQGEAGVGKSRLIAEFIGKAERFNHLSINFLPEYQNNALYNVFNIIKSFPSLEGIPQEQMAQQLEILLQNAGLAQSKESIPILCSWMDLPMPKEIPQTSSNSAVQKPILFKALLALLKHSSTTNAEQATLLIFEDIHWADPVSIDFIEYIARQNQDQRFQDMIITTSRTEAPRSSWQDNFKIINLSRLTRDNITQFVHKLFDHKALTPQLLNVIVNRTDGIPLFIEEIVDMLKQKGLIHNLNGITDFKNPDDIKQIPDSLRDSLQQKLDLLVYGKETAQLASAIGREFEHELLIASSTQSESKVQTDLEELISSGIVYQRRKTSGDSYIFKHSLVRDTAYESMSKPDRTNCHLEIAKALTNQSIEQDSDKQVEIAKHFANAREFQKAVAQLTIRALDWKNTLFDDLPMANSNSNELSD